MRSIISNKGVPLGSVDESFCYWSSSEKDSHHFWYFDFRDKEWLIPSGKEPRKNWVTKSSQNGVRAIRAF